MQLNGGVAGMGATYLVQPADLIKVCMQLGQGGSTMVLKECLHYQGFPSPLQGLVGGAAAPGHLFNLAARHVILSHQQSGDNK